jgi:hypothetical protein
MVTTQGSGKVAVCTKCPNMPAHWNLAPGLDHAVAWRWATTLGHRTNGGRIATWPGPCSVTPGGTVTSRTLTRVVEQQTMRVWCGDKRVEFRWSGPGFVLAWEISLSSLERGNREGGFRRPLG